MAAAGVVAAEKRPRAGAKDELVPGIVAAALEDRPLHGRQDVALEGPRSGKLDGLVEGIVRQGRGAAMHLDLGRRLDATEAANEV